MAHEHIVYMMLAEAAAQARDADAMSRYVPALEELALRDGHQPYLAVAHRAAGVAAMLAGHTDEAAARLQQALAIFEERNARWQIGRTLVELAGLALGLGDTASAQTHYSDALAHFAALGARPDIERTEAALTAIG